MRPPCETIQRDFLPDLRMSLAKKLSRLGLSQTDIAKRMEITQAAVSKYLSQEKSPRLGPLVEATATKVADLIVSGAEADAVVEELCSSCMQSRIGGSICKRHRQSVLSLGSLDCQICVKLLSGESDSLAGRSAVLRDMQDALRIIESSESFGLVMPQVRANLVACGSGARTTEDVAGVPGRITMINGKPRAPLPPQFGASRHTAQLLLHATAKWPTVRSCLCVSGREEVVCAAESVGFYVIRLDKPTVDPEEMAAEIRSHRGRKDAGNPAVCTPGGIGVEPILYLFGKSATELSDLCIGLVVDLSTSER